MRGSNRNPLRRIENLRLEMLEDLALKGANADTIIFYKKEDETCVFEDYEMLNKIPFTRDVFDTDKEFRNYKKEIETNTLIPGTYNIIYSDENYEIMPLKEAIYVLCDMLYKNLGQEIVTIYVNLWIHDITPYKLSQNLGIARQSMKQFLDGTRPIPDNRKTEIAEVLEFDEAEYNRERSKYVVQKVHQLKN